MIVDEEGRPAAPEPPGDAAAAVILEGIARHEGRFVWRGAETGLDFATRNDLGTGPNRARLKLFSPKRGTAVLLLYKDSQIPFSRDRFAYGALICRNGRVEPRELEQALAYALSGLHPERRPGCLKRALPFTVPW